MIYSERHNAVIAEIPDPTQILAIIPEARRLADGRTVVPMSLSNMQVLKFLGHNAISPIQFEYDWPSKYPEPRPNQLISAAFKTLHDRNIDTSEMRCVDCETEYLSPTGWRRMDAYDGGKVAQYHLESGEAEFVQPEAYHVTPCEWMYHFQTVQGIDQKLSPGHRMLFRMPGRGLQVASAEWVANEQLRLGRGFQGRFPTTFKIRGTPGIALTDDQLRLQVAVMADGHVVGKKTRAHVRVKKERKKARLRMLLERTNTKYIEKQYTYAGSEGFSYFTFFAPRKDKVFIAYYWDASPQQLAIIADEVVHWDGTPCASEALHYYSVERQSLDFVQYAFTAIGRAARLTWRPPSGKGKRPYGRVHACAGPREVGTNGSSLNGDKRDSVSIEPTTDGNMYCFTVPSTFLVFRRNGRVFVSGNTGKTLSSLWAADYLMCKGEVHKALIVSPLSTLERVWDTEIRTNLHNRRTCTILHGDRARRLARLKEQHNFYIINPDGLGVGSKWVNKGRYRELMLGPVAQAIVDDDKLDLIIFDEVSVFKHGTSERYKIAQHILLAKEKRVRLRLWGLTGTPAASAPTDAYALGILIYGRARRSESFKTFQQRTMTQLSEFKWRARPGADKIVADWLQPGIRFTRNQMGFPRLSYVTRDVPLSEAQKKAYAGMKRDMELLTASGVRIDAVNEASLRSKLIQISCGAMYDADHEIHAMDCKPRLSEMDDIIEEAGGQIIIYAPFTSVINLIHSHIVSTLHMTCERIYGPVATGKRNAIFKSFQDEHDPRVIVADPRTVAYGLPLHAADTVIWFGPTDNLEHYEQANDRIVAPDSAGVVFHLSSSPVEREIYRRLQEKKALQGSILALLRAG